MTRTAPPSLCALMLASSAVAGECPTLTLRGDAVDLSDEATTQRRAPAVAYNAVDGEYLVAWFDLRNPGNNDVFGQRVDADGGRLGANLAIMEFASAQVDPAVAHNPIDNEYLVAWRTQQAGFFNKARGRRLAAGGAPIGSDFFIGEGFEMDLVHNPVENQYLQSGRLSGIRGQRISNAGGLLGGSIVIASAGAPAPNGGVAYDTLNNRYLATWRNQTDRNLQGQIVAADGTLVGGPILISPLFPESGRAAAVAFDAANGRYLVAFGIFQENRILGQFVAADGTLVGGDFTIVTGLSGRPAPSMSFSPATGAYVVGYIDGGDVFAGLVTADGDVCADVLTVESGTESFGIAAIDHNGASDEFLFAWVDNRNLGENEQDIFARVIGFAPCPEDLDGDGAVGFGDLLLLLAAWGDKGGPEDLDGDGTVGFGDLLLLLAAWGPCP